MAYALVFDARVVQLVAMARERFEVAPALQWVRVPTRRVVEVGYTWSETGGFQPPAGDGP